MPKLKYEKVGRPEVGSHESESSQTSISYMLKSRFLQDEDFLEEEIPVKKLMSALELFVVVTLVIAPCVLLLVCYLKKRRQQQWELD